MTTTTTAAEFAQQLRALADHYDAEPDLPLPATAVRITSGHDTAAAGYLALRRLFPHAPVDTADDLFVYVHVDLGSRFTFSFWKSDIGRKQTVTREVQEYVLPDVLTTAADVPAQAVTA